MRDYLFPSSHHTAPPIRTACVTTKQLADDLDPSRAGHWTSMIANTNSCHSAMCRCDESSARYITAPRSTTLATFQTALRFGKTTVEPGRNLEKWSALAVAKSSSAISFLIIAPSLVGAVEHG